MSTSFPPHPHGVLPEGSLLLQGPDAAIAANAARTAGLGRFAWLDDSTLIRICSFATPAALAVLCATSDTLSAFASFDEHWRVACLQHIMGAPLTHFCGSWKITYIAMCATVPPPPARARTRGVSVFSDALLHPHQLTYGPSHFGSSPRGPPCPRIGKDTSAQEFSVEFEAGVGRPVVIEGSRSDSVGAGSSAWDEGSLRSVLGDRVFHAGGVNFRLADYLDYAASNTDDQPLYLFDPTFGHSAPEMLDEYAAPSQACLRTATITPPSRLKND